MDKLRFEKAIEDHLERLTDLELIFLKGHLLIEQMLTELLELHLLEPERLKVIRPLFSNKLEIYLAIHGNSLVSKGLEAVLKEMNALRNKLAHRLIHPGFEAELIEWSERAARRKIGDPDDPEAVRKHLIGGISMISAYLWGAVHGIQSHKNSLQPTNEAPAE